MSAQADIAAAAAAASSSRLASGKQISSETENQMRAAGTNPAGPNRATHAREQELEGGGGSESGEFVAPTRGRVPRIAAGAEGAHELLGCSGTNCFIEPSAAGNSDHYLECADFVAGTGEQVSSHERSQSSLERERHAPSDPADAETSSAPDSNNSGGKGSAVTARAGSSQRSTRRANSEAKQIRSEQLQSGRAPSDFCDLHPTEQIDASASRIGARAIVVAAPVGRGSADDSLAAGRGDGQQTDARDTRQKQGRLVSAGDDEPSPVGCQESRSFNQNKNELASSPSGQPKQQRIKVTLSKPRREFVDDDDDQVFEGEETRKLGEFYTTTRPIDQQLQRERGEEGEDEEDEPSVQVNSGHLRARGKSTATLISGSSELEQATDAELSELSRLHQAALRSQERKRDSAPGSETGDAAAAAYAVAQIVDREPRAKKINQISTPTTTRPGAIDSTKSALRQAGDLCDTGAQVAEAARATRRTEAPPLVPLLACNVQNSRFEPSRAGGARGLTRLEQENLLRRIASQRRRAPESDLEAGQSASEADGREQSIARAFSSSPAKGAKDELEAHLTTGATAAAPAATLTRTKTTKIGADEREGRKNFLLATANRSCQQPGAAGEQQQQQGERSEEGKQRGPATDTQDGAKLPAGQRAPSCVIDERGAQKSSNSPARGQQDAASLLPSKQLAIYINGKIRSNSIFCSRSASSNSFASILKSFHSVSSSQAGPGSDSQQQRQVLCKRAADEAEQQQQRQQQRQHEASIARGALLSHASKSLAKCLVPAGCKAATTSGAASPATHGEHQRQSLLASLVGRSCGPCDYLASSCRRREGSAGEESTHADDASSLIAVNSSLQTKAKIQQHSGTPNSAAISNNDSNNNNNNNNSNNDDDDEGPQEAQSEQPTAYKLNPSSMFLRKAMRYYRLWIYSANLTILLGAVIFMLSALYVASDYRFQLIVSSARPRLGSVTERTSVVSSDKSQQHEGTSTTEHRGEDYHQRGDDSNTNNDTVTSLNIEDADDNDGDPGLQPREESFTISLSEPIIVLAYLMIAFQLGLLQALGCFGAIQMKERLIQAFWYLILGLIISDVVILIYWLQRYDLMLRSLRDEMTSRLEQHYGYAVDFDDNFLQKPQQDYGRDAARHNSTRRNDQIFSSLQRENTRAATHSEQLEKASVVDHLPAAVNFQFDKIFTQIFDRIQAESQCCGVSSSLDYKHTRWRRTKVLELRKALLESTQDGDHDPVILEQLLAQLPLVPASCCRPASTSRLPLAPWQERATTSNQQTKVIYPDDSQLPQRARVPAWSPSMVVDNLLSVGAGGYRPGAPSRAQKSYTLQQQQQQSGQATSASPWSSLDVKSGASEGAEPPTLADVIDKRWMSGFLSSSLSSRQRATKASSAELVSVDEAAATAADNHDGDDDKSYLQATGAAGQPEGGEASLLGAENNNRKTTRRRAKQRHYGGRDVDGGDYEDSQRDASSAETRGQTRSRRQLDERAAGQRSNYAAEDEDDEQEEAPSDDESGRRRYWITNDKLSSAPLAPLEPFNLIGRRQAARAQADVWAVETKLDERGRVLSRLVELKANKGGEREAESAPNAATQWSGASKSAELGLTRDQLNLIEGYLNQDRLKRASSGTSADARAPETSVLMKVKAPKALSRRSILSAQARQPGAHSEAGSMELTAAQQARARQLKELQKLIGRQAQLATCLPRSHYDEARIYTRGCQAHVRAWIQSSANVLFVMGFCVLTVIKFCSLILLRLEIREMIHKIRVLKGMATEYNALHDLEPYLPRSSVCAQAAELTPAGVSSALCPTSSPTAVAAAAAAGQPFMGQSSSTNTALARGMLGESVDGPHALAVSCSSPTNTTGASYMSGGQPLMAAPRRLGGSFSEAVVAATAVAQQQRLAEQQQQCQHLRQYERAASLVNCARVAPGKGMMGGVCSCATLAAPRAGTTAGGLCPCATSISVAARLSHSASQQSQAAGAGGLSLRSDLFPPLGVTMPRRHTAVSVCPAAAAAATAAAHHLMIRRGTFGHVNPLAAFACSPGAGQSHQSQSSSVLKQVACGPAALSGAASSANMLQAKSLNYLNQHRHSAHAVPTSHLLFGGGGGAARSGTSLLNPASRPAQTRRSSNLSTSDVIEPPSDCQRRAGEASAAPGTLEPARSSSEQQTESPQFKRQASGGAQSAIVNFSLDIAPAVASAESRRSIH